MVTWAHDIGPVRRQALIESARDTVLRKPGRAAHWLVLGKLLVEAGRLEEARQVLNESVLRLPMEPKLHLSLANVNRQVGEFDSAVREVETAASLAPNDRETALRRFDLFVNLGHWDRIAPDLQRVAMEAPARRTVLLAHSWFANANDDPQALLIACEAALVLEPRHTLALHHQAVALSMLGRNAEARAIIRLDDFVSVAGLPAHDGGIGGAAFLELVAAEIRRNPTLVPDPKGKATRGGRQTRALVQTGDTAVPLLLERIRSAVDRYVESLPVLPHPFTTNRPQHVRLDAWAVVYTQDGLQKSHLHPEGWISGVTYITAPKLDGENTYRGPLMIGDLDTARHPAPPPWGIREVEPVPGRITLFPSFVPHATRSTRLAKQRICVAFDVVPA